MVVITFRFSETELFTFSETELFTFSETELFTFSCTHFTSCLVSNNICFTDKCNGCRDNADLV
jgi:hypothetical protein